MPNGSQQTLLNAFNNAAGNLTDSQSVAVEQGLIDALGQTTAVIDAQTQATSANTDALAESKATQGSSNAGKVATDALSTASEFLGGGLSLMPVISLFSSLFGGGDSSQPAQLAPYSLPASLTMESTMNNQDFVWGENGLPRSISSGGSNAAPQITVQVQAMDSQSFLDHSDDIAQAVRKAMLNMNPINDMVSNL